MTVYTLTQTLTVKEMIGWSKYHASKSGPEEVDWSDQKTVEGMFG